MVFKQVLALSVTQLMGSLFMAALVAALPPEWDMYGPTSPYGSPLDVLGPVGMGQRLQTIKDAQTHARCDSVSDA